MKKNQLQKELILLRRENRKLIAQLNFHKNLIRDLYDSLGVAGNLNDATYKEGTLQKLIYENEKLKSQIRLQRLTGREQEVLQHIVAGFTSKEIAGQLEISKFTVDTHRKNIHQKLEIEHPADLFRLAMFGSPKGSNPL